MYEIKKSFPLRNNFNISNIFDYIFYLFTLTIIILFLLLLLVCLLKKNTEIYCDQ